MLNGKAEFDDEASIMIFWTVFPFPAALKLFPIGLLTVMSLILPLLMMINRI